MCRVHDQETVSAIVKSERLARSISEQERCLPIDD